MKFVFSGENVFFNEIMGFLKRMLQLNKCDIWPVVIYVALWNRRRAKI